MKSAALLIAFAAAVLISTPAAQAAKVGKLAGTYSGQGTLIDKRSAPISTYRYTFADIKVKVTSKGVFSGSATVTAAYSSMGGAFLPITTRAVTVTGTVSKIKVTKSKVTALGTLKFSDGTEIHGTFSVAAKTGKGTFKVKSSDTQFDVDFVLSKKK